MNHSPQENKILENIKQLASQNKDIEIIWLYGSRARGNAHQNSDYDLAVAFSHPLKDPIECRLRPELLALKWKKQLSIDLSIIDINQVPLPLAYTVVYDNYTLYSNNDFRRLTQEQRIMSKWELDHQYHKKHYL